MNLDNLKLPPEERPEVKITCMAFSTNNKYLAIGYEKGFVRILTFQDNGKL